MQLYLSLSGIILAAILLYFNARNNRTSIYLGIFFLLAGLYSFSFYALLNSKSVAFAAIALAYTGVLSFLTGPSLYFFIRGVLKDDPSFKKHDLWHLLPGVLILVMSSTYLFSSWEQKKAIAEKFTLALNIRDSFVTPLSGNNLLAFAHFIFPALLVSIYVIWSTGLFLAFLKDKREKQVFFSRQSTLRWIKAFLGIEMILVPVHLWVMVKIIVYGELEVVTNFDILLNVMAAGPLAILLLTFFSPEVLYGLPRIPIMTGEINTPEKPATQNIPTEKTARILETNYLQSISRETDACMEQFRPFTSPGFSLAELSVLVHIPVHHLSYFFREEKKQSFVDYRNEWRIRHAKKLMAEGKTDEITLEAIGLLSGFTSRNAFYRSFKELEGISPGKFAESRRENG